MEIVHGPFRIGGVYLAGVISGALLTTITDPKTYLAGASGGIYALLLAHLPTVIMNWRDMKTFAEWMIRYEDILHYIAHTNYSVFYVYVPN